MKIAAMAAGAVGAYFGGRMQAGGHDVAYIARRAHLDALRKNGLKIESVHGDLHLPKVNATPDPKEVGPVDVVLFAVKLWDTETAAELAATIAEQAFAHLDAPVARVGSTDTPVPFSRRLEALHSARGRLLPTLRSLLSY